MNATVICAFLFAGFASLYLFNLDFLSYLYSHFDVFGMDSVAYLRSLHTREGFLLLHPVCRLFSLFVSLVGTVGGMGEGTADRVSLALLGAGNVVLCFLALYRLLRDRLTAALFAVGYGFFFSNLVCAGIPDTYLFTDAIILVYLLFLVSFRERMTFGRYAVLSLIAGLGAANNLPLISLLAPHTWIAWRQRKKPAFFVGTAVAGAVIVALTCFGVHTVLRNRGYANQVMAYDRQWGGVSHFGNHDYVADVLNSFYLSGVVAPGSDLNAYVYGLDGYYYSRWRAALVVCCLSLLVCAGVLAVRRRDALGEGLLVWLLSLSAIYVYFNPWESFIYSSQVLPVLCLLMAAAFAALRFKFKVTLAAAVIAFTAFNNLQCLYSPCDVRMLPAKEPVLGYAYVGRRIATARREAGITARDLSERTKVALNDIAAYETGGKEVSDDALYPIADALQKPLGYFLLPES